MKIIDELKKSIIRTSEYNPDVQVAPACILWPDKDSQWGAIIPDLQQELKSLFILGDYTPEEKKGPAIWLRCIIENGIEEYPIKENDTPMLYLPGYSRHDLRAIEECPNEIKPLAELQYRGAIWSQISTKDWTILAFLKSDQGGLGLDVTQDTETKHAMRLALPSLLEQDISLLQGKQLDKDFFNKLLMGGDPVKDLLLWINDSIRFKETRGDTPWNAFVQVCKSQMAFDPSKDGVLAAAEKLAKHEGLWKGVWDRYREAPQRYPLIPENIRKCSPPAMDLFSDASTMGGWPQWNEDQEAELRKNLLLLENESPQHAAEKIVQYEEVHKHRRNLVWAELGEANCAEALKYLTRMVIHMANPLAAGSFEDLRQGYEKSGWLVDRAVLNALSCAGVPDDFDAIASAVKSIYPTWLDQSARYLQQQVLDSVYPGVTKDTQSSFQSEEGLCVLFVDGLRFDTAKTLEEMLERKGHAIKVTGQWAALPTVTATGKVAVSPVKEKVSGSDNSFDFETEVSNSGQSLKGGYHFKKLLEEEGWTVLGKNDSGHGIGRAWCELGDIDHEGHDRGWKLAKHISTMLQEVSEKIDALFKAGWSSVRVVTDHGWLLMPKGLSKIELPAALTDSKWGRCAAIKPGAVTDVKLYPWYWNSTKHFALADGASCYKAGLEYSHGGISLQECYIPEINISSSIKSSSKTVNITDVKWRGLRCKIAVEESTENLKLDIRLQAGEPSSSVVLSIKEIDSNGMASVIVEDEDLENVDAYLVLLDKEGKMVSQMPTVIGGDV
ncbi:MULTISPECIES: BREX-1 system phosphatase PglZ type B [unclassified Oceanispirochaeta]|uniref:BREX-1 system phosphatase PglZ type B n=1 Tax=unclassified Oceanispirochaeta TaxID=2635722 RepID=UPI000E09B024|nr:MULTISPECIES: BREX-1 system phosphatase PglZ type B [unclassified Oceanispirochaeta]MBF9018800.1 BREX-1 system phosphatase PglZ type B [Oceanispirochaeta sp. M2]NPD75269.1 BREX-1 system phosphatase PglZ type B [Oceanispirochaeta sp. M1]RDG28883.1 BREX-1 system phosphatase PglZ type B [Oceanispirochaeta sp. M1]